MGIRSRSSAEHRLALVRGSVRSVSQDMERVLRYLEDISNLLENMEAGIPLGGTVYSNKRGVERNAADR